ncbi:MAG: hypothetical protein JWN75_1030 [Candidatus Saccharibacteria bacterium]|nr:hypothetical protein [Candidatus Saccharibacteria bacterium]
MVDDNQEATKQLSDNAPAQSPRSYNFLLKLSRRLGTVATKSSLVHDVKTFLNQEITIVPPERLFGSSLPKLIHSNSNADKAVADPVNKEKDLRKLVERSHELLMSANTVFPISVFPDTVTVDRTKVTITRRDFFWSSDVLSIRIEDVLNVSASVGPLFGSLTLASRVMSTIDHFRITHLWRNDAIRLKQLIQGYVIAQHNKIDTAHLSKKELIDTLIELGHDTS